MKALFYSDQTMMRVLRESEAPLMCLKSRPEEELPINGTEWAKFQTLKCKTFSPTQRQGLFSTEFIDEFSPLWPFPCYILKVLSDITRLRDSFIQSQTYSLEMKVRAMFLSFQAVYSVLEVLNPKSLRGRQRWFGRRAHP